MSWLMELRDVSFLVYFSSLFIPFFYLLAIGRDMPAKFLKQNNIISTTTSLFTLQIIISLLNNPRHKILKVIDPNFVFSPASPKQRSTKESNCHNITYVPTLFVT